VVYPEELLRLVCIVKYTQACQDVCIRTTKKFMSKPKVTSAPAAKKPVSGLMQGLMAKSDGQKSARREGYPVPMNLLSDNNKGTAEFGLDITKAPVPTRRYAADFCSVREDKGELRIIFGQYGFDESDIQSALIIRMSATAVRQFANSLSEMGTDLSDLTGPLNIIEEALSDNVPKPNQMANMMANICSVAVAGQEACLDFYHMSAFAIRKVEGGSSEMEVEPVVRVDMRSSLFVAFARRAIQIAKKVREEL
jgi:hypothetical protein